MNWEIENNQLDLLKIFKGIKILYYSTFIFQMWKHF